MHITHHSRRCLGMARRRLIKYMFSYLCNLGCSCYHNNNVFPINWSRMIISIARWNIIDVVTTLNFVAVIKYHWLLVHNGELPQIRMECRGQLSIDRTNLSLFIFVNTRFGNFGLHDEFTSGRGGGLILLWGLRWRHLVYHQPWETELKTGCRVVQFSLELSHPSAKRMTWTTLHLIFDFTLAKQLCFARSLATLNSSAGRIRQVTQFTQREKQGHLFCP